MSNGKRLVEKQMEFPTLELIVHPTGAHPVSVVMESYWYLTGEVLLNYTTAQSLRDAMRLMDHARNYMADELHAVAGGDGDPPFKTERPSRE